MKIPSRVFWLIVPAFVPGNDALADPSAVPFREITFEVATAAAAREGKVVFIDFFTTWCQPCKRLDAETWTDPGVGQLVGEKAIALKIDAEKEGLALAKRYKVNAYPTLLLVKPDGAEVDRIVGFKDPAAFSEAFRLALAGKTTLARAIDAVEATEGVIDHDAVKARYDLGQTLDRKGDQAGALREYLWCFDVGMVKVKSYTGVRTSFLLGSIARLAKKYPPARAALQQRCDAAETRAMQDTNDRNAVQEFAAICAELGDDGRMMMVFDQLPSGDPRRRSFGLRAFRVLLPQQRYTDALSAMPYESMARLVDLGSRRPASTYLQVQESTRRFAIRGMLDYIEVLAGAEDLPNARKMIGKLIEFDDTPDTRRLLDQRLTRAKHPELRPTP